MAQVLTTTATPAKFKAKVGRVANPRIDVEAPVVPDSDTFDVGATEPWQVLGRRWHTLRKGFPDGRDPEWPLELVDSMLKLIEQVAGEDSIHFTAPDRVNVTPNGNQQTWLEMETKTPGSLKVTLAGPYEAIDESALRNLDVTGPIETSEGEIAKVTLNLTQLKHARSRKLRSFLKGHLERCDGAT